MAPNALIAEDEATLADELREMLMRLWPQLKLCAVAVNGSDALRALESHTPEVLFLDIELPGVSGLEVARRAGRQCHVVFVTAYDRYAVAAFDQGAVDYVLKPIEPARLADTVERLQSRMSMPPVRLDDVLRTLSERMASRRDYVRWITAPQGRGLRLITVDEVRYFQADNKCTRVVTAGGDALIYRSIRELADELDPSTFWQIHRGTIVNLQHIAGLSRDYRGRLHVNLRDLEETLAVSAPYAHRFKRM